MTNVEISIRVKLVTEKKNLYMYIYTRSHLNLLARVLNNRR